MRTRTVKPTDPTDAEVVHEVLLGNTDSFGLLFDRYAKKIFGYLWHFTGRREDCEDFLQETFYRAYVNLRYCREREKFSSWLFSIAHNVAVSNTKKLALHYRRELPEESVFSLKDIPSPEDLNLELARAESAEMVRRAIHEMPSKYKEVVVLFYYNDLSLKEIGESVGIPINTVKTRLHRAREHLGEKLRSPIYESTVTFVKASSHGP